VTAFLLIRHATNDFVGKAIAGRAVGVHLNATGRAQAERLADRLASTRIDALYTSPRERACETAAPFAARLGLVAQISPAIDEIEFGEWTGRTFPELEAEPQWPVWVERRSAAIIPGGERILEVQRRFIREMERLADTHPNQTIALFSHGDPIRAGLAHFLGTSLDNLERFEIAPASISIVVMDGAWAQVRLLNYTGSPAA